MEGMNGLGLGCLLDHPVASVLAVRGTVHVDSGMVVKVLHSLENFRVVLAVMSVQPTMISLKTPHFNKRNGDSPAGEVHLGNQARRVHSKLIIPPEARNGMFIVVLVVLVNLCQRLGVPVRVGRGGGEEEVPQHLETVHVLLELGRIESAAEAKVALDVVEGEAGTGLEVDLTGSE